MVARDQVMEALHQVVDPELGINIFSLSHRCRLRGGSV
jgi:metal-sulfur cluster biosynthetic enzyme